MTSRYKRYRLSSMKKAISDADKQVEDQYESKKRLWHDDMTPDEKRQWRESLTKEEREIWIREIVFLGSEWPHNSRVKESFKERNYLNEVQSIDVFEQRMAQDMLRESHEVSVTAFCSDGLVRKVRVVVGSVKRVRVGQLSVVDWCEIVRSLNCDEVRNYHNHPGLYACVTPSYPDSLLHRLLNVMLRPTGVRLRSFIIKQKIFGGGWKMREYSDKEWRQLLDARRIGVAD